MTGETPTDPDRHRRSALDIGLVVTGIDLASDRWDRLASSFTDAEAAGCDTIWLTDHAFAGHPCGEPFVLSTVAAGATSHCMIGTGILQLPLRRSAAVAKAASTLQLVSTGRFRLGVGVGQHQREFERSGVAFAGRGAETDRMLDEISRHQHVTDDWFSMRPSAPWPVPIWLGGTSKAALRRTARFGSGWLSIFQSPRRFAATSRLLDDALAHVGRRPEAVERHIVLFVCPTDGSWSRSAALGWLARQFPAGSSGLEHHVITGSVEECAAAIDRFVEAGSQGVALQVTHPDPVPRFARLRAALG